MKLQKAFLLLGLTALAACATPAQEISTDAKSWVGRPFVDYQAQMKKTSSYANRTGWKEQSSTLPNGNLDYVAPINGYCVVHWEIDKAGTIVGYKLEGEGCN
jgi:hypothetical protein